MKFVDKEFSALYEEKRSKFIAHLCPYKDFDKMMQRLKDEHPKARHFVYAYRYLNEFDQIVENSSDDGEPRGTSGKPSLNVLGGAGFINSAVVIVRYFGGIKLGTGGLVRAYGDAVNLVLQNCEPKEYKKLEKRVLELDYDELSKIEYLIANLSIDILNKEFTSNVKLYLESDKSRFEKLQEGLPIHLLLK